MTVTIVVDDDTANTIAAALDLYTRIQLGQWERIIEHCPHILTDRGAAWFGPAAVKVRETLSNHTNNQALKHPAASLSIHAAPVKAQVAYDVWQQLDGHNPTPITDTAVTVTRT